MSNVLVVGSGLFGSIVAYEMSQVGHKVTVVERRSHIGGNVYTEVIDNIVVHTYGAHIFRTNNDAVWKYINQFAEFNNFVNSPIAVYKDEMYNLPFNMNTFAKMWNIHTPEQAKEIIESQRLKIDEPKNLEEFALSVVGKDVYTKLIKGYTEKQWNKKCSELPVSIMRRIPIRYTFDNNYYNAKYQGVPIGGYTKIIEKMLENCTVLLNTDGKSYVKEYGDDYNLIIYTGSIDEFYDYELGKLEYRSLSFEHKILNTDNFQGNAVVNYTDYDVPYTRIIEHKFFDPDTSISNRTCISYETPVNSGEPYYPIETEDNLALYKKYKRLAKERDVIVFCGRLGSYKYTDMEETIKNALDMVDLLK